MYTSIELFAGAGGLALGFVIAFIRENESKKYIREHKTIVYFFGIKFLCFDCSLELKIERKK